MINTLKEREVFIMTNIELEKFIVEEIESKKMTPACGERLRILARNKAKSEEHRLKIAASRKKAWKEKNKQNDQNNRDILA
jgi:hypothetical protein